MTTLRLAATIVALTCLAGIAGCDRSKMIVERDVAVPMRDDVVLRADIYRPMSKGPHPVLVYRTPYGKHFAADDYETHIRAVERGYAVVLQDVRGRYASDGFFNPYFHEGEDGYDTIAWAARQPWSNGDIGTYGLSYPGAVQWLAAVQSPPQLKAMVPAMTFSTPGNFFYMNGVFDMSWLPWIYFNIAPDARIRKGLPGPTEDADVAAAWQQEADEVLSFLPLAELPMLRDEAPFYFEWLRHGPTDPWWSWAEVRGRYANTDAAVLNISGWYDEAYGPEGAVTNHNGLVAARAGDEARSQLILGPWQHGETARHQLGELDFGPHATIDYDELVLDFLDRYLQPDAADTDTGFNAAVRYFVMGSNEWREASSWPPPEVRPKRLCLKRKGATGTLGDCARASRAPASSFRADPAKPVVDPYEGFEPHDYQMLAAHESVLTFETETLPEAVTVAGSVIAKLFVSCDCRDFDLWVKLLDVYPDGRAINLMGPGADVQRVSYRNDADQELLRPDEVVAVTIDGLLTANRFDVGHRIRIQVSASFAPHLSRNLQTGLSETVSSESVPATIVVHHSDEYDSSLELPLID